MSLRPYAGRVRIISGFPPCQLALSAQALSLSGDGLVVEFTYPASLGAMEASDWQALLSLGKEYRLQIDGGSGGSDEAAVVRASLCAEEWRAHKAELRFAFTRVDDALVRLLAEWGAALPSPASSEKEGGGQRRKLEKRFY